jgi:hypothetical protein
LICVSCSPSPEEQVLNLLENRYANLEINHPENKQLVLSKIKKFFEKNQLDEKSIDEFQLLLNEIEDGHVQIFTSETKANFESSILFHPSSQYILSCVNCEPSLIVGNYEILKVNQLNYADWLNKNKFKVSASSLWGREYRLSRLLSESSNTEVSEITVKNAKGEILETKLNWQNVKSKQKSCVKGARVSPNEFLIDLNSLWCDQGGEISKRVEIFNQFKKEWDQVISHVNENDLIILDLRENGGGGDFEVEYVINTFIEKSVLLFRYQYLTQTNPGLMKYFFHYWPIKHERWMPVINQYSDLTKSPLKKLIKNEMKVLIGAGCFSSCESVASVLKENQRAKLYGGKTHGGSGDPVIFKIKGTPYSLNLPTCRVWQNQDEYFEGVGVNPNI